jgi:hypothetical protein
LSQRKKKIDDKGWGCSLTIGNRRAQSIESGNDLCKVGPLHRLSIPASLQQACKLRRARWWNCWAFTRFSLTAEY